MIKTGISKYDCFKTYYYDGSVQVGQFGFPKLEPTQSIPKNVISFNERNKIKKPSDFWIDHFIDDNRFECEWNNPDKYIPKLSEFKGVIGPDFSMKPEFMRAQNIWNCAKSRILCYYFQKNGIDIIPAVGWIDKESLSWSLDGVPTESSIAVSSNGCLQEKYCKKTFLSGIDIVQKRLDPSHIVVCGKPIKELSEYSNVIYYPNFMQRRRGNK